MSIIKVIAVIRSLQLLFLLVLLGLVTAYYYDETDSGKSRIIYLSLFLFITIFYVILTFVLYKLKKNLRLVLSIGESVLTLLWLFIFLLIFDFAYKLGPCTFFVKINNVDHYFSCNWCKIIKAMIPFVFLEFLLFSTGFIMLIVLKVKNKNEDLEEGSNNNKKSFISRLLFDNSKKTDEEEKRTSLEAKYKLQDDEIYNNLEIPTQNVDLKTELSKKTTKIDSVTFKKQKPDESNDLNCNFLMKKSEFDIGALETSKTSNNLETLEPLKSSKVLKTLEPLEPVSQVSENLELKKNFFNENLEYPEEKYKVGDNDTDFNLAKSTHDYKQQTTEDCISENLLSSKKQNV